MATAYTNIRSVKRIIHLLALTWMCALALPNQAQASCTNSGAGMTYSWKRWECVLEFPVSNFASDQVAYKTRMRVHYGAPGEGFVISYAYWDGRTANGLNHRFVLRSLFPAPAFPATSKTWSWTSICEGCPTLGRSGTVLVNTYSTPAHDLYQFGLLRPMIQSNSINGVRYEYHSLGQWTGKPFVWIGDTAWAAPMRATQTEWEAYLDKRKKPTAADMTRPGITVVQIGPASDWMNPVVVPNRPPYTSTDRNGNRPFHSVNGCTATNPVPPNNCSYPNPAFWDSYDRKVQAANEKEIYVFISGLMEPVERYPDTNQVTDFARWLAARMAGNFVIFSPGFDSAKVTQGGQVLQSVVGNAIKAVAPRHLVTNHWSTATIDDIDDLHAESWLNFEFVQTGFNNGSLPLITQRARNLVWQISGTSKPGVSAFSSLRKPVVNGEAVYDEGGGGTNRPAFTDYRARQAGYLSWLSGAFGVSFGVGGIWEWGLCGASTTNPCSSPPNPPAYPSNFQMPSGWRSPVEAVERDSRKSIKYLGELMRTRLARFNVPGMDTYEQDRIRQSTVTDETKKMVMARTSSWILAYMPHNLNITIAYRAGSSSSVNPATGYLYNPTTGVLDKVADESNPNNPIPNYSCAIVNGVEECTWTNRFFSQNNPEGSDRVLALSRGTTNTWFVTNPSSLQVIVGRTAENQPLGVLGQLVSATGQPMNGLFSIYQIPGQEPSQPQAARDGRGKFLVVWQVDANGDGLQEVWGRYLDLETGEDPVVYLPFRVSPLDGNEHFAPSVGMTSTGEAVVAWTMTGPALALSEIWARSVLSGGASELSKPLKICGGVVACLESKVAASQQGKFSIAWTDYDAQLERHRVLYQSFLDYNLEAQQAPQQLNSQDFAGFWLADIKIDAAGAAIVEYEGRMVERSAGVYAQAFDAAGIKLGSEAALAPPYPEI